MVISVISWGMYWWVFWGRDLGVMNGWINHESPIRYVCTRLIASSIDESLASYIFMLSSSDLCGIPQGDFQEEIRERDGELNECVLLMKPSCELPPMYAWIRCNTVTQSHH